MKDRGILFSAPMVSALLADRKTQTRRIVDPRNSQTGLIQVGGRGPTFDPRIHHHVVEMMGRCPYGGVDGRLWVKETFAGSPKHPEAFTLPEYDGGKNTSHLLYRADVLNGMVDGFDADRITWKPAIFMPRWASRLTFEIVEVQVERLQSITEAGAIAEGITGRHPVGYPAFRVPGDSKPRYSSASSAFEAAWDAINGKRCPWASNP